MANYGDYYVAPSIPRTPITTSLGDFEKAVITYGFSNLQVHVIRKLIRPAKPGKPSSTPQWAGWYRGCSVSRCVRWHHAKGMCRNHYDWARRNPVLAGRKSRQRQAEDKHSVRAVTVTLESLPRYNHSGCTGILIPMGDRTEVYYRCSVCEAEGNPLKQKTKAG